jgi:Tfp pilus assembly protein PilV
MEDEQRKGGRMTEEGNRGQGGGMTGASACARSSSVSRFLFLVRPGFTLIETLAAGVILAMAVAVLGTVLSHAYASLGDARDERRAAVLLNDLLTKVDMIGPARIASEGPRQGKFDGTDERFSWSIDIQNRPQGHLYEVAVTLTWNYAGADKQARIRTYLNDAPKSRDATLKWRDL